MLQSPFTSHGQRTSWNVAFKRLLAAVEKEQLERFKDGHGLQEEEFETTKEGRSEGLQKLGIDKHKYDSSAYGTKALVRAGLDDDSFEGIGTGRLYDEDGEILGEGIIKDGDNPENYQNFYQGRFFHSRLASTLIARAFMAYEMGCDMLPTPVQPFIMKRNSPMLQRAINNKKTPKHIRRFLNRNTSRVDGLRSVPMRRVIKQTDAKARFAKAGAVPTTAIIHSAVLQKSWKTASKAYGLLIRCPETVRGGLMGLGVQILAEIKKPPHNLSTCTSFLGFLMLEMTWLRQHNRENSAFTQKGRDVNHLVSTSADFLRSLTIVHLKFKGTPEELLTRLDEDMMVPPYSEDPAMMYLRGIVMLRCVYHDLDERGVLSGSSIGLLDRAKEQFESSHEGGVIFCLEEYLTLIEETLDDNPRGEVKLETTIDDQPVASSDGQGSDGDYETVPWWEKTLDDGSRSASEREMDEGSSQSDQVDQADQAEAESDDAAVPWWEQLNSDGGDEEADDDDIEVDDDDEIKVDDDVEIKVDDDDEIEVDEDSELEVKPDPEEESGLAGSGNDVPVKHELDEYGDLDTEKPHSGTDPLPKPEPVDGYDFDFDFDSESGEEVVVKTEPADIEVDDGSQSPVPPVKKEGFATLDDLLGSMPGEKSKDKDKKKDKKKKKKSRNSGHDDSMDFEF